MRLRSIVVSVMCGSLVVAGTVLLVPSIASASATLWVNGSHVVTSPGSPGSSCTNPGYNTIQAALNAASPGRTINICTGTYTEQLQITQAVTLNSIDGAVTVALPASPVDATTSCDVAIDTASGAQPDQDGVSICGDMNVTMDGITIDASWPNVCDDSLYGVLIGGGATLDFDNGSVIAAGVPATDSDAGCQGGTGFQAGVSEGFATYTNNDTPVTVGHLDIDNSTISGYQKNGMTADGNGSSATITNTTVTGAGFVINTAQNGIQISDGASGDISRSTISDNECSTVLVSSCGSEGYQAGGVLFYGSPPGSKITHSTVEDNDYGLYYEGDANDPAPTGHSFSASNDTFTNQNYASMLLDAGYSQLHRDSVNIATNYSPSACNNQPAVTVPSSTPYTSVCGYQTTTGIVAYQYVGQPYGATVVGTSQQISNQQTCVAISSDATAGDPHVTVRVRLTLSTGNANELANNALPGTYTYKVTSGGRSHRISSSAPADSSRLSPSR